MDGASQWRILTDLCSLAILVLLHALFCIVNRGQWFDGIMLMNSPSRYPLQVICKPSLSIDSACSLRD